MRAIRLAAAFCCRTGSVGQEIVPATAEEVSWIQEVLDGTYKKKSTRDRSGGPLADRFVVVSALRSEHPGQAARNHSRVEDPATFANLGTCDRLVGQVCRKKEPGDLYRIEGWPCYHVYFSLRRGGHGHQETKYC